MNILEYSSSKYLQGIPRKSKMLKYIEYSGIFKVKEAGHFQKFKDIFSG